MKKRQHEPHRPAINRPSTNSSMCPQEFLKSGVSRNGFSFAIAILLVAIRQQFAGAPKTPAAQPSLAVN